VRQETITKHNALDPVGAVLSLRLRMGNPWDTVSECSFNTGLRFPPGSVSTVSSRNLMMISWCLKTGIRPVFLSQLDDRGSFPNWSRDFSLRHRVQTGSEAQRAFYLMDTWDSFSGIKAAGALRW